MTAGRIQRGDTIQTVSGRGVVLKVGRGSSRSAYVYWEDGRTGLLTEVDYWHGQGTVSLVARKPENLKFAKQFCREHLTPVL